MGEYIPPDPNGIREYDFAYCHECGGHNGKHIDNDDGTPCPVQN